MQLKLLACDVLTREIGYCLAKSPHMISMGFTPKGEHVDADKLRDLLQAQIDAVDAEETAYDAVLLGYGLCGNAISRLRAGKTPLVVPRAHDCTTLFLGSKAAFEEHFGANPSQEWASVGYAERSEDVVADAGTRKYMGLDQSWEEMVAMYGEENAKYLLDTLNPDIGSEEIFFIDVPETRVPEVVERIQQHADAHDKKLRTVPGNLRLIEMLILGDWPEEEFQIIPPGETIKPVYDLYRVIESGPQA